MILGDIRGLYQYTIRVYICNSSNNNNNQNIYKLREYIYLSLDVPFLHKVFGFITS